MYAKKKFHFLVGIVLIGVVLAAELTYVLHKKNEIMYLRDGYLQDVRESIALHDAINDLIQNSNAIVAIILSADSTQGFDQFHDKLETLLENASQRVKSYPILDISEDMQKWNEFLQKWNLWYINDLGLLHRMEDVMAARPSLTVEGFRAFIAEGKLNRFSMADELNKSTSSLIRDSMKNANELLSLTDGSMYYIIVIKVCNILVLILAGTFLIFSVSRNYKKNTIRVRNMLKNITNKNNSKEILDIFDEMMDEQKVSLRSIASKMQKVDVGLKLMSKGIRQVSADQINLFNFSTAFERAQLQHDGFSDVSGDALLLAEQAGLLANNISVMADQVRNLLSEVMSELQQITEQAESDPMNLPVASSFDTQVMQEQVDKLTGMLTKVTSAMTADPLQGMVDPKEPEIRRQA